MFAIVQFGSSQFKVSEGDSIDVNQIADKEGKTVILDKVLLITDDKGTQVGQPYLKDVKVTAKVARHHLGKKLIAFKFRRREHYQKTTGHRQKLTTLTITKITPEK